jgi:glucokinase
VLELGGGIGVGATLGGRMLRGRGGRFGRLMAWNYPAPKGLDLAGSSLGALLTEAGLIAQYGARRGGSSIRTGIELLDAAGNEDAAALATVTWAAIALSDVIDKIRLLADPSLLVIGGGLGRALFTSELTRDLFGAESDQVRASSLGQDAVALGGLLVAQSNVTPWILSCIESGLHE